MLPAPSRFPATTIALSGCQPNRSLLSSSFCVTPASAASAAVFLERQFAEFFPKLLEQAAAAGGDPAAAQVTGGVAGVRVRGSCLPWRDSLACTLSQLCATRSFHIKTNAATPPMRQFLQLLAPIRCVLRCPPLFSLPLPHIARAPVPNTRPRTGGGGRKDGGHPAEELEEDGSAGARSCGEAAAGGARGGPGGTRIGGVRWQGVGQGVKGRV